MANVQSLFDSDSPFLKASDHENLNKQCVIKGAGTDDVTYENETRTVCWIDVGAAKRIQLSKTNGRTLIGAFGAETSDWIGKKVLLSTRPYNIDGKQTVGWVVVPMIDNSKGFDDEIPF